MTEPYGRFVYALNEEEKVVKKYYKDIIGTHKRIACVDIGWSGMNINALKIAVETNWKPECKAIGLLAGMIPQTSMVNPVQLNTFDQDVYLFSPVINTEQMSFIMEKVNAYPYFYEVLSGAPHTTIYRIEENNNGGYEFTFNVPDVDNYWVANEIRRGMMDFANIYTERFRKYPFMFRIPGNDSALIVRHELMKDKYLSDVFGDLSYQFSRMMPSYDRYVGKVKRFLK